MKGRAGNPESCRGDGVATLPNPAAGARSAVEVDAALEGISSEMSLLELLSPSNLSAARRQFFDAGCREEPQLEYSRVPFDPQRLRERLFAIPATKVEPPTLAAWLSEKQRELDRQLTLLELRGTEGFLAASLDLYGQAEPELVALAEEILDRVSSHPREVGERVGAREMADAVRRELDHYGRHCSDFPDSVAIEESVAAGIMVSGGRVVISATASFAAARVEALLHHEVGTHVLTWHNGSRQPYRIFRDGLGGYDELQEGLGVLAEWLTGGLSGERLRVLAARVVAAHGRIEGRPFEEVFTALRDRSLSPAAAWSVTLRAFRSGGLTKDVVYLRGFVDLLEHLGAGGLLEPLYVGKIALHHYQGVLELIEGEVLSPPCDLPRFLSTKPSRRRLERSREVGFDAVLEEICQ